MSETTLCDTALKLKHVEAILQKYFKSKNEIATAKATSIGDSKGFLSDILKIEIEWKESDANLPKSVVAKIPTIRKFYEVAKTLTDKDKLEQVFKKADMAKLTTKSEIAIYEIFSRDNYPPACLAKFYGAVNCDDKSTDAPPFLLFEDLSHGTSTSTMWPGLNERQVESLAMALADIQAHSVLHPDFKKDSILLDTYNQVFEMGAGMLYNDIKTFKEFLDKPENALRMGGEKLAKTVEDLITNEKELKAMGQIHKKGKFVNYGIPEVLVQGDCWSNNILFKKNENGEASDELLALIDWQICHPGSPVEDFVRLMTMTVSPTVRREHFPSIFTKWYDRLKTNLAKGGIEMRASRDQLWELYQCTMYYYCKILLPRVPKFLTLPKGVFATFNPETDTEQMLATYTALWEDYNVYHGKAIENSAMLALKD